MDFLHAPRRLPYAASDANDVLYGEVVTESAYALVS